MQLHRLRIQEQRARGLAGNLRRRFRPAVRAARSRGGDFLSSNLLVPRRRPAAEELDDERLPSEEMARSLRDLDLVNRRWGGSRALENFLAGKLSGQAGRIRILDVGAGSGDVTRRLAKGLRERGLDAAAVAVDLQWRHLAAGRRPGALPLPVATADAFHLPFAAGSFDWVVSTLLFHHLSPEENERFLRELARVACSGFAVLDLRRHVVPLLFVSIAGRLLFESRVSVADGVASVRQAYTRPEAAAIAAGAVGGSRVRNVFPFRLLISGPPESAVVTRGPRGVSPDRRP